MSAIERGTRVTEHAIDPASAIEAAAHRLRDAEMTGAQCEPVSRLLPEQDIGAAYAVQQLNVERRIARGGGSSAARSA